MNNLVILFSLLSQWKLHIYTCHLQASFPQTDRQAEIISYKQLQFTAEELYSFNHDKIKLNINIIFKE